MIRRDVLARTADLIGRLNLDGTAGGDEGAPNNAERRAIVDAVNAAHQEMRNYAPRDSFKRQFAGQIRAPLAVEVDITPESTELDNLATPWEPWMEGCTIALEGDSNLNRINSETELALPYLGNKPLGVVDATIYSDSIPLDPSIVSVHGGVRAGGQILHPVPNEVQPIFSSAEWWTASIWNDYGFNGRDDLNLYHLGLKGKPSVYYIETETRADGAERQFMRFRSLPTQASRVDYWATVNAERWTDDGFTLSSTESLKTVHAPGDHIESVLLPFIFQNMTKWFAFEIIANASTTSSENILTQIYQDYEEAISILKDLRPQLAQRRRMQVRW